LLWRGKVGMGDVKLMAVVGFYMGKESIMSCMITSLFLAAMFGMTMVLRKKINKTMGIPFAPFVFLATVFHYIKGIG
jgi:prepilin signal peptidase PulO-like enzyme (type II secretory pathway)